MRLAKYGLAAALVLGAGVLAMPEKAEAGGYVGFSVPGFSLYFNDYDRRRYYRPYYRHNYYYGRPYYRHRHYRHRHHRHHHHHRHGHHWR